MLLRCWRYITIWGKRKALQSIIVCYVSEVEDCAPNPCLNGGTCLFGTTTFTCICEVGYEGERCEISECHSNNYCLQIIIGKYM